MYECEKCIHEEVCDQSSRRLWGTLSGEQVCSDFKDRDKHVEVVHGRWLNSHTVAFTEECSQCGFCVDWTENGMLHNYNYCPNCGAKMDGDGNV